MGPGGTPQDVAPPSAQSNAHEPTCTHSTDLVDVLGSSLLSSSKTTDLRLRVEPVAAGAGAEAVSLGVGGPWSDAAEVDDEAEAVAKTGAEAEAEACVGWSSCCRLVRIYSIYPQGWSTGGWVGREGSSTADTDERSRGRRVLFFRNRFGVFLYYRGSLPSVDIAGPGWVCDKAINRLLHRPHGAVGMWSSSTCADELIRITKNSPASPTS